MVQFNISYFIFAVFSLKNAPKSCQNKWLYKQSGKIKYQQRSITTRTT